jgi:hypothetical protein
MATFPLRDRHRDEAAKAAKRSRIMDAEPPTTETAGGDGRFRVPTIGLNSGHMPGTRPDFLDYGVSQGWYNAGDDAFG